MTIERKKYIIYVVRFRNGGESMQLDVSELLNGSKTMLPFTYLFTPELSQDFPDVTFGQDVPVTGCAEDKAGYMCLTLKAQIPYQTMCARCLTPVQGEFGVSLTKEVAVKELLQEEEQDRYALIENRMLDLDQVLTEELLISFPSKFLCKEDCLGLCANCGKDLNEGPCACPKRAPDPRLDVLRKLLESES